MFVWSRKLIRSQNGGCNFATAVLPVGSVCDAGPGTPVHCYHNDARCHKAAGMPTDIVSQQLIVD